MPTFFPDLTMSGYPHKASYKFFSAEDRVWIIEINCTDAIIFFVTEFVLKVRSLKRISWERLIRKYVGWKMVHNFLDIYEKTEKSTYIWSEYSYSVFNNPYSVSNLKPCDYPPW